MSDELPDIETPAPATETATRLPKVILSKGKTKPFLGRHPWVLDKAIQRVEGQPEDGDVVEVANEQGKVIARGVYNSRSRIRVRLYTWGRLETLDDSFWRRKLDAPIELRSKLGYITPDGAARLVFSEADGLSGLIVDRYID